MIAAASGTRLRAGARCWIVAAPGAGGFLPAPCPTERKPDVPANRRRTRTGPAAGRKPEPGGGRTRFDRSRSAAVQHGAGPGLYRRARTGAGDQQALRLPAAFGQRREPQDLRLAARAVRARRAEQDGLTGEARGSDRGRDALMPAIPAPATLE